MSIIRMKTLVLFVGVIAILAVGCNEQQVTPSVKQSRLIAAENKNLLKQIQERDEQIETLKQEHMKELAKQKELLDKCQQERDGLKERMSGQIEAQVQGVLKTVIDQNKELREKVEILEAELQAQKEK